MMTLWIVIAAMLLLAVIILLWPLAIYKGTQNNEQVISQQQKNISIFQERLAELENEQTQGNLDTPTFEQLKIELEKTLLGDVQFEGETLNVAVGNASVQNWLVMGVVASIFVLGSLATYNGLGASEQYAKFLLLADNPEPEHAGSNSAAPDFAAAVIALKAKLAENPEDIEKLFLLANSYAAMGDFQRSGDVYNQIAGILGEHDPGYASAKAAYAQMMYQVAGETMNPVIQLAINDALKADPGEPTALILQGLNAYQNQAYSEAITAWEKAKIKARKVQVNNFIDPAIAEARRQLGETTPVQQATSTQETSVQETTSATASIKINLDISPALRAKVSAQDRVFVFAKAGMPMPLAAERLQVQDLPITIILDDTKAAMPTAKISSAEFVDITARVALSGSPRATKGDLYATVKAVAVHKGVELTLVIDKVVQ